MERGGPPAAVERFWCYVAGDDGWNRLTPALPKRRRATASTLFEVELGSYELYLPDEETLAALSAPVSLLVSEDGLPFSPEITGRLGKLLGAEVATTPGTHAAYHDHPYELAEAVRPFLGRSPHERRRCGTVTGASMRDARPVHVFDLIPVESLARILVLVEVAPVIGGTQRPYPASRAAHVTHIMSPPPGNPRRTTFARSDTASGTHLRATRAGPRG